MHYISEDRVKVSW